MRLPFRSLEILLLAASILTGAGPSGSRWPGKEEAERIAGLLAGTQAGEQIAGMLLRTDRPSGSMILDDGSPYCAA